MPDDGGYRNATAGGLIGGVAGGLVGYGLFAVYAEYVERTHDWVHGGDPFLLPLFILIILVAIVVGEAVGCGLALRTLDDPHPIRSGITLGVLLVLGTVGIVVWAFHTNDVAWLWLIPLCFLSMPAVARRLVNARVQDAT